MLVGRPRFGETFNCSCLLGYVAWIRKICLFYLSFEISYVLYIWGRSLRCCQYSVFCLENSMGKVDRVIARRFLTRFVWIFIVPRTAVKYMLYKCIISIMYLKKYYKIQLVIKCCVLKSFYMQLLLCSMRDKVFLMLLKVITFLYREIIFQELNNKNKLIYNNESLTLA